MAKLLDDKEFEIKRTAHRVARDLLDPKTRQFDEELQARMQMALGPVVDKDQLQLTLA